MELNLIGMTAKERWDLYQVAESLGLFWKLPPQPKPLSQPLVHLYQIGAEKQLRPYIEESNPELTDTEKRACMFAWHVWRERTDVWEMPSWQDVEYDPGWLQDGYSNFLLYNQFVSAFELERYFLNPWIRAAAWASALPPDLIPTIPKFDLGPTGHGPTIRERKNVRHSRVMEQFAAYTSEIPRWWANQRSIGHFAAIEELSLAHTGYVSVALRDLPSSPQPGRLVEGNWHNGWGNDAVRRQKLEAFSWVEFMWRRDELEFVLPNVVNQMMMIGPRGASFGTGSSDRVGKSEKQFWSMERKLLNRLAKRIDVARGFVGALAEIADSMRHR